MDRRIFMAGGAGVAALGAAGIWYGMKSEAAPLGTTEIIRASADGPTDVDTSGITEMYLGAEDAPVVLTEYASFTCPHCANFHATVYPNLKKDYIDTGKVRFHYRDVYFDRFGLWAAMIARCEPTKFFGISDMLYDQQREWLGADDPAIIADNLRKIGRVAGLGDEQIEACLADQDMAKSLVAWFQKNATDDDVSSTPTLFINDTKHSNMSYADLKKLLDAALES
ncbi:thioredoxin domain-containing protein [Pseudooceanicola sp. 216_PA32_1]|jgi:protein-disulfide isomerase|uniref:Thioredoxin domain-containing protein n=1 Tax=Pseudooceanicola pacificus TaxID=2676438 RepID=A0A844VZX3_9RHOB|nr:DsbA family protein [Pseudooceanicola pacificus]MWB76997.1 thioredoxin domain-containing protein [Pseudooceanicola pacificus]